MIMHETIGWSRLPIAFSIWYPGIRSAIQSRTEMDKLYIALSADGGTCPGPALSSSLRTFRSVRKPAPAIFPNFLIEGDFGFIANLVWRIREWRIRGMLGLESACFSSL